MLIAQGPTGQADRPVLTHEEKARLFQASRSDDFRLLLRGGPWELPVHAGERLTLHYAHSLSHEPVWEELSVGADGRLYLEELRCTGFSAGMDHWPGHGRPVQRGPYLVIEEIHQPLGKLVIRVGGEGVDHVLLWRGFRVVLARLADPGTPLTIEVRKEGLWDLLIDPIGPITPKRALEPER
jgi:hypothetical protein